MKPNTIQKLGTSALTILALVCLMAPSAMAQSGGPPLPAYFDGVLINQTLADSLANSTLLNWGHCKGINGNDLDNCIILTRKPPPTP